MNPTWEPATLAAHRAAYAAGADPVAVVREAYRRLAVWDDPALCLHVVPEAEAVARAMRLRSRDRAILPLFGVPVAVKDNLDLAGHPTTAGCPAFASVPTRSATAVQRLEAAGAIVIAKTNLDQFATGLVGVRSPAGAPRNPLVPGRIPGGSSSGSGCIVAAGIVALALGTDTAGSGRVPAACTHIVGLKPTPGRVSSRGLVPAVRSLDCVSVFAHTAADAAAGLAVISGFDAEDAWSRRGPLSIPPLPVPGGWRVGVPSSSWLAPCSPAVRSAWGAAVAAATHWGAQVVEIDFAPFAEAAATLYGGAWVAERTAAVGDFLDAHPGSGHPVVEGIIRGGRAHDAVAAHRARYRLMELRRAAEAAWERADVLLLPTIPGVPTLDEVAADPIGANSRLGVFTNFANLLLTSACAVPAGIGSDGLPTGVTVFAPAWCEASAVHLAGVLHQRLAGQRLGACRGTVPEPEPPPAREGDVLLAVCGAHLRGLPLHHQLERLGARLVAETRTAPCYRLVRLDTQPPKPGLVRQAAGGTAIAVEVYAMTAAALGSFIVGIASPLGIGRVLLEDGREVSGFLCEAWAAEGREDISASGGWREHLRQHRG